MFEFEEPELYVHKFSEPEDRRIERERQRDEGRRLYRDGLVGVLADLGLTSEALAPWAETILDYLFLGPRAGGDDACSCSCHPRLPDSDFHGYGVNCSCQLSAEERRASSDEWAAEMDAYRESPEGLAESAARQVEEDQLVSWLIGHADVVVTSYGGMCPEQWTGSVAGHSFYFRERHDDWRIECDLQPTGHFARAWCGGDLDDDASFELIETEIGEVIAEGTINSPGYGRTPAERIEFIAGSIRTQLRRQSCQVHTTEISELERRFERPVNWCPACGMEL